MKPVIGIPLRYAYSSDHRPILYLGEKVRRCIQKAGGEVFSITPVQDVDYIATKGNEFLELTSDEKQRIQKSLKMCDGLFFPGGVKMTPYDRYLLELAIQMQIPVFGVCLGMQLMSCYQGEVKLEANDSEIVHNQGDDDYSFSHEVIISKESKLYSILGEEKIMVNSFHNYHVNPNHIYQTVAVSSDQQIEAIEYPGEVFNIGVQWHPEISYDFDSYSRKLIDAFIAAAKSKKGSSKEDKK